MKIEVSYAKQEGRYGLIHVADNATGFACLCAASKMIQPFSFIVDWSQSHCIVKASVPTQQDANDLIEVLESDYIDLPPPDTPHDLMPFHG